MKKLALPSDHETFCVKPWLRNFEKEGNRKWKPCRNRYELHQARYWTSWSHDKW